MILHTDSLPIGVIHSHSQRLMMEVSASSARGGLSRSSSKERTVVEDSRDPDGFCPYHWSPRTSSFTINVAPRLDIVHCRSLQRWPYKCLKFLLSEAKASGRYFGAHLWINPVHKASWRRY